MSWMNDLSRALRLATVAALAVLWCTAARADELGDARTNMSESMTAPSVVAPSGPVTSSAATAPVTGAGDSGNSPLILQLKRRSEQDRAQDAERRGLVAPYTAVTARALKDAPGDIVSVRLYERSKERWIYELTVLSSAGRYTDLVLDARTVRIIAMSER
jgi:uncharacterized membrane protein YkoI